MTKFWAAILLYALASAAPEDGGKKKMDTFRLPTHVKPMSYDLKIEPNFRGANSTFAGEVKIAFKTDEATKEVTLNIKDLHVTGVIVTDITRKVLRPVNVTGVTLSEENEQFTVTVQRPIIVNRDYLMTISYEGKIRDDLTGFYLSSYDESNATKWLAVTQFEPTYARRAFPCFDEPSFKAVFNVSVVKQKNQIALSNMPIERLVPVTNGTNGTTDMITVYFESSPPMSTYLLAFYVGEFVMAQNNSGISIYTHTDYMNQTKYSGDEAPKHLKAMWDYTGIPCSINKLDLLAIPDFGAGAMENWGINTFQEYYLLLHTESKTKMKMRSSIVMQHEFTHQWFGNQVTCAWWDYLWLNEGFARYFQYFATGTVNTKWQMDELFVVETHQGSLAYDQTPRHPITSSVNTPDEIADIFDTITYSKAASVIRMLRYLVTERIFKESLHNYLELYLYNVATPTDLFSCFDNKLVDDEVFDGVGNGLTVDEFMTNWTTQAGYPVLNITKDENTNKFLITQSRFLINVTNKNNNESQAWHVGLTFTTESSKNFNYTQPSAWTNRASNLTVIPAPQQSGWYIFNIQSTGFYRVNYDVNNWMALIKQLKENHTAIHVLNRAQLIDDAFTLARAGYLSYSIPLNLTKYLENENSVIPFYSAMNRLSYLEERMPRNQSAHENFKAHASRLAGFIYKKLEDSVLKKNTDFNVTSAWDSFSNWACKLNNDDCVTNALKYFKKWQTGEKIPADIKDVAFCIGVKNSTGNGTFYKIFNVYKTTKSISEKNSAMLALGCSENRTLLTEYLNHVFDGPNELIKKIEYHSIVSAVSKTPLGLDVLHEFLSNNLNRTLNEVSNGEDFVTHVYSVLASKVTSDNEINKIKSLKDNSTLSASVKSSFDKSFEKVDHNLLWFNAYSSDISQWAVKNEEEIKIETETTTTTTTTTTATPATLRPERPTQAPTPVIHPTTPAKPSGAPTNAGARYFVLQLTLLTVFVKSYIL